MKQQRTRERLAYCKNGDCVAELNAIFEQGGDDIKGGPLVYIASFIQWGGSAPKLVLSRDDRNAGFQNGSTLAKVFKRSPAGSGRLSGLFVDTAIFFKTFFSLLFFRLTKVLCAPSGSPMWAAYLAAKICSSTFVHTRHAIVESSQGYSLKSIAVKITQWIILHADSVICHGPYLESQLLELGVPLKRLFQFNLSYDYLHDLEVPQNAQVGKDMYIPGRYILFSGRMTINKGVLDLLHAAQESLESDENIFLVYAGGGPAKNIVIEAARNSGLEEQVICLGQVDHALLPGLISDSTAVALPTQSMFGESRCKSAIESIVLGKPVIAPDFGPFPYVIDHNKNGLLFVPDSVTDLACQVKRLLNDDHLLAQLSAGAKESAKSLAKSRFTFEEALNAAFSK